jgi:hypothetical protein
VSQWRFDTEGTGRRREGPNTGRRCSDPSPQKTTSAYWTLRNGDAVYPDIAWADDYPLREVAPIAGMIAFYNEKLDIFVDGALLPRPQTIFT